MKAKASGQSEDNHKELNGKLDFLRQQFQNFFESSFDAILITDIQTGKILAANPSALTLLQVKKEKIVGFCKAELHLIYDTEGNEFNMAYDSEIPQELNIIRQDGSEVLVEIQSVIITYQSRQCIMERYRNISNHKQSQKELKNALQHMVEEMSKREELELKLTHSRNLMQYVIEHSRSAIAVHDKDLRYVFVSNAYLNQYNVEEKEIIGKHHYEVFPDLPKKWRDVHQRALKGEICSAEDDPYVRADGKTEWTRWECRPWFESDGSIGGIIIYTEVITKKKEEELELIKAKEKAEESDRLKTAFLQNMSHEVRTPLNTIVGFSQLLVESSEDPRHKFYAEMITAGSDRLIRIVSDVIEISQLRTSRIKLNYTQTCVDTLIGKVLDPYQKAALRKNITLKYNSTLSPDQEIMTDHSKLEKILIHLVDNAVKFTYGPGLVEIASTTQDRRIRISITDTGIGIPEDMQRVIFEPFRQIETDMTKTFGGNGLGLSLAKAYTELLNGRLILSSSPGVGTTVEIELPTEPDHYVNDDVKSSGILKLNTNQGTLLVVEDEYTSFLYLEELLKSENVNVLRANNGKVAVELCRNNKDISLILMDIKMPVMDGTTSARIIKTINPDIPIIAQTAFAVESQREDYMNTFDDLITKPIIKSEFRKLISKYFA